MPVCICSSCSACPAHGPFLPMQDEVLALAFWHTPRGKWWPVEVSIVFPEVPFSS